MEPAREARKALAESIPRRELELALRDREEVLVEVEKRIQEMGLNASAEELTDLLEQRAHLVIGLDKCRLASTKAGDCRAMEAEMTAVEASFRAKAGLSAREFRGGRRDTADRDAANAANAAKTAKAGTPVTANAAGDSCTCALSVYSGYRWMNRWWALECNNHASHGVCSNNVDSAHSPGTGAMTGDINLYFGSYHQYRECPDDGTTCFHGPSTAHSGQWGNVCSCDTWHSQYYNPTGDWYGGDLSDSQWVHQVSTPYFTVAGSCDGAYVTVSEYIKENDPWCCDDPMGTLWVSVPVSNGSGNSPGQASVQNCNGGSQSGVNPYCGTFGATIWVAYVCSTYSPPPPPECDPEAEQYCYSIGWNWQSWDCNCVDPCQPDPYCTEWNYQSCSCYRY
ncbi:MAG TPA: hypothetical protein VNM67_15795 [Thermoanaerobaculia bacterium]|nr:hypothetical protein [Thermoanaerobaculia bacterium]